LWRVLLIVSASVLVVGGLGVSFTRISWRPGARTAAIETPRIPFGIWCRMDGCRFWDRQGALWGTALKSVGPLLLLVDDQRSEDSLDPGLIPGILAAVDSLPTMGLRAISVTLPDAEPGGVRITISAGYDLCFDALGDVADQLSTLSVFLADRAKDPAFKPQYLDLRTPGRVYYR
jgi:hypothetical protein